MPKVMLINVTHSEESRVGIMNEGVLESFEIESLSRAHLKGNIYKGIVHRIHPALEAAFVDIGAERDAFLPLDEICFRNLDESAKGDGRANGTGGKRQLRIRDVLRPGQQILVQITKEQFANKPPTISTFYSLPGRHLVLLPGTDDTGISRRIEGEDRDRLRKAVDDLKRDEGFGLIVRTVAGLEENGDDLARDLDYLKRLWANVQAAAKTQGAPSLVYREHDIVQRAIRDFYTPDISEIYIDDEDVFQRARDFLRAIIPGSESVLRLYRGEQPLFSAFKVEEQIESVFGRRVPLRSGGSIVIDGTEALTAIDVNSGGAVRGANPEETAFRTNREAAAEVARQLRLRDIGGIIVVDFIDMRDSPHIREIEQLMRDEMHIDKARHETSRISSLGLMQISRQRLRPAAAATSHVTCPLCQGYGSVRTHESAALGAIRKIHNRLSLGDVERMLVTLPHDVGLYVLNQKREDLANLESRYESRVEVRLSERMLPHEIETEVKERSRTKTVAAAVEPGGVAAASSERPAASTERQTASTERTAPNGERATAEGPNGKRRRRRRRRRGGRGTEGALPTSEAADQFADAEATASDAPGATSPESEPARADSAVDAPVQGESLPPQSTPDAATSPPAAAEDSNGGSSRSRGRRSRGRRGGRRHRPGGELAQQPTAGVSDAPVTRASSAATSSEPMVSAPVAHPGASHLEKAAAVVTAPASPAESSVQPIAAEASASEAKPTRRKSTTDSEKPAKKPAAKKTATKAAAKKAPAKKTTKKATPRKSSAKKTGAKTVDATGAEKSAVGDG